MTAPLPRRRRPNSIPPQLDPANAEPATVGRAVPRKPGGMMATYDVIIVGLRCAGAPLAMLLARKGYRVLGIDRATFPSDTMSTHFLWPRTTAMLSAWGLLPRLTTGADA
jgi:hypothetical protein